ncbi:ABC transporter ATP-binding protein [Sphaerochaeta sp. PS]|uniref:ABC transporter ATP-binding protein n=1 Tax=Sphaerochaeta sp. PS TaxID=3076336 RepID=UPI0028A44491|nr:ABC transporter ATP-binding protein [Sphaerochaeta sp. PS]MDT4762652.1 ABC transporter ATP-binding protein [Sphaerochaeta sp. PS]
MLKNLTKQTAGYRVAAILTSLFVVMEVMMDVLIPYLMANLIDQGIDASNINAIWKWGLILLGCAVVALFFGVLSGYFAALASSGFSRNVRRKMFYTIQDFSFSNIDTFSSASLITRLTTDVTNVQRAYQMLIRIAVRSPFMLAFSFFMATRINARLALVYLVALPILALGMYFIIKNAYPLFVKVFKIYDKLNSVVQENVRGVRVVKSFVREEYETEKFKTVSEDIYQNSSKSEKIIAFNSPLMQGIMYLSILAISYLGARLIVSNSMTTGQLMSFITYTSQILMSLMMLSMVFVMITMSRASAFRIEEVLSEKSDLTDKEGALVTIADGSLDFESVSFSHTKTADKLCLKNINLHIASGEVVGIIGSTGSGKSSLVQLIPRLYDVYSGSLKVGGVDVRDYQIQALRDSVSIVLQKSVLFSGTIKENLRWGNLEATDEQLVAACKISQADAFVRSFPKGYDTYIEQDGSNLSGGQKQRLSIARSILKQPKILILDDSTSAVDTKTDAHIRRSFRNELKNTTKIIIAQRINSVMDADKIVVLDEGEIQAIGTHAQLLETSEVYREIYDSQSREEA